MSSDTPTPDQPEVRPYAAASGPAPSYGPEPGMTVLASGDGPGGEAGRRKKAPWWLVGGAGLLTLVLVGGVTVGVRALSGGGAQPEDVLPAGAYAFAKLDLDPSAGQKIDGIRFMRKFPSLRAKVSEGADLRKVAFESVAKDAGWGGVDFAKDVKPWLGQRIGVAGYAPDAGAGDSGTPGTVRDPKVVVALQVTDEGAARKGLDHLISISKDEKKPGFVIAHGYALLAASLDEAQRAAALANKLADASTFRSDLSAAGDGVAAAWMDMDAARSSLGLDRTMDMSLGTGGLWSPGAAASGRSTYVLHFDGADALEVTGRLTGARTVAGLQKPLTGFTDLPGSSVVALGLSGGDQLVKSFFDTLGKAGDGPDALGGQLFRQGAADAGRELGIDLPADLEVLLGSNFVAALDGKAVRDGMVEVGARSTTDAARAGAVLDKIEKAARAHGADWPMERRRTADGIVVASTPELADQLAGKGNLGDRKAFRRALPDVDGAGFALWVDVRALSKDFFNESGHVDQNLAPIAGVGMTAVSDGKGSATYRLRLVTD